MLKVLERKYKQTMKSALLEFPNSVIVMSMENIKDDDGYVLAVSTSVDSQKDLSKYLDTLPSDIELYISGFYSEGAEELVHYCTVQQ